MNPPEPAPMADAPVALVYRDRIVPRSEAQFMRRQYLGFTRLRPVWVGCRIDEGLQALGVRPIILGGSGHLGAVRRTLFKQAGLVPNLGALQALRPRIVHAQFGRGGALALPIARALGVPLVVTFHGGDATKATHYRRRLLPTAYQRRLDALKREAAAFVCVSSFIRDVLVDRGFPPEKLVVLRNGVDVGPEPIAEVPERPYVLFVGRLVPKKGLGDLIAAHGLLSRRMASDPGSGGCGLGPSAPDLVVIGEGAEDGSARQNAPGVRFLGWQDNASVRRWMRGAMALCVPSVTASSGDSEGLPTVAIEAMAEGTPVIGTRHAGIVEAVQDRVTGLLVPQGDPAALAAAIAELRDSPERRRAMGRAARARAFAEFDAATQSRRLEDLLLSFG
jgi:glycosyltransferase involved in cell wall biosynthesis